MKLKTKSFAQLLFSFAQAEIHYILMDLSSSTSHETAPACLLNGFIHGNGPIFYYELASSHLGNCEEQQEVMHRVMMW